MARKSSFTNMLVALLTITLLSSMSLAAVYESTKETIEQGRVKKINEGIALVVPPFDNDPSSEKYALATDTDSLIFYPAKKDGNMVGTAVQTFSDAGFSGRITLMVGFLPDGVIHNIEVISHNETPGLGDKIDSKKSKFSEQFKNKDPKAFTISVKKDGGGVDAITASTISSKAYCDAVNRAYKLYSEKVMGVKWDGVTGATNQ